MSRGRRNLAKRDRKWADSGKDDKAHNEAGDESRNSHKMALRGARSGDDGRAVDFVMRHYMQCPPHIEELNTLR